MAVTDYWNLSLDKTGVEKVGRIGDGGSWKAQGRVERSGLHQRRGYDDVHAAVDDHTDWPTLRSS